MYTAKASKTNEATLIPHPVSKISFLVSLEKVSLNSELGISFFRNFILDIE